MANSQVRYGQPANYHATPATRVDGDPSGLEVDSKGNLRISGASRGLKATQQTTITSSTVETTIVTAVTAVKLDLYGLIITNTSATACNVTIKDATSGTTQMVFAVPAADTRGFMVDPAGAVPQTTAANNWTATCSASVASIQITALTIQGIT